MAYSTGRLRVGDTTYTATLLSSATCPLFTTGLYLAFDEQLQRSVAIKQVTVPDTGAKSKDILTRIRDEARLMDRIARGARAKNPHLVLPSVHDLALDAQSVSIKMDVVPGERLDQTAAWGAPATAAGVHDAVALASDVCAVLTLLHSRRYAHRDIAPKNIMVRSGTTRPHATLLDFGLAVVASIRPALLDGEGTLGYRAPEQTAARDRGIYPGPPSDVYSIAAVLYELLTGTV